MFAGSYSKLLFTIVVVLLSCLIEPGESNAERRRRQTINSNNQNLGLRSGNPNSYNIQPNNVPYNPLNNQQQSVNKPSSSSQGQGQPVRSRGFYSSPNFKPPAFSGDRPVGWFDTKYQYWVSNQDGQMGKIDGKNMGPSNFQGKAMQSPRDDGGAFFFDKLIQQNTDNKNQKSYYLNRFYTRDGRGSTCYNRQTYNGYQFGKFRCPLPANTGMNQMNTYCCGIANYQYCCNEQEYNRNQGGGYGNDGNFGKHGHGRNGYYAPNSNRTLAIVLPIVGIIVIVAAVVLVFMFYKKTRNTQSSGRGFTTTIRTTDKYSAVPQDTTGDKPIVPPRELRKPNANA